MSHIEKISGGYVHFDIQGQSHRVYFESAGTGPVLLCLHTAGSDSRQYRGILNCTAITERFQVVCFDLPYHGKSSPPAGWQQREYQLTSQLYVDTIIGFMQAMDIERPLAMGCSIGGRVVLHLALQHPEKFRGLIGLQSGAHVNPYYNLEWLHRPDVHGGEVCAGIVSGLIGPHAAEAERWETLWHYMQGGPGVFKGDLHFYKAQGDLRALAHQIDTRKCPLHLLTGEFDYSCTPDDSRDLAQMIAGAHLKIMPGLGHFPMSEAPEEFIAHLLPVLQKFH
ncbi:MAG: alpha/beta hydrolase [Comamonas sp.]|uniref:alpha/beta fold hydrolase n=1 Tax=Comamonas sp. TaxID=34028 RepID=UPI002FC69616